MKTRKFDLSDTLAVLAVAVLISLLLFYLTGCKSSPTAVDEDTSNTPRTAVPAVLQATWCHGTVSISNFYNRSTGAWTSAGGEGLFYRFDKDEWGNEVLVMQSPGYSAGSFYRKE